MDLGDEVPKMIRSDRSRVATNFIRLIAVYSLAVGGFSSQVGRVEAPLVWVLSTGGTIAGRGASSTSLSEYKSGSLLGEELVKAVPEIRQYANVKVEQLFNVASPDLTLGNWLTLA